MSRTHKIQRSRTAHQASKVWKDAHGSVLKAARAAHQFVTPADQHAASDAGHQALLSAGLGPDNHDLDELRRTSGRRYGNQRKMRAAMVVQERRIDRKRDPKPLMDAEGDLELSYRPSSPARRRGPR